MKLFRQKKHIITTDPSLRPSERFERVLIHTLQKEGFKHLKSKNEFVQNFKYGKRVITLSYNHSFGYISSVECFIKIIFSDLEKAFKKVYPNYGWTNWTIHQNLGWTQGSLYDLKSNGYTDQSINLVANEFFDKIKPRIDSTFSKIYNYQSLHNIYNTDPLNFIEYLPHSRLEKRIINGLILAKNLEPSNYPTIENQYLQLIDRYKGNDIKEIRIEVEIGLSYLKRNDIRLREL